MSRDWFRFLSCLVCVLVLFTIASGQPGPSTKPINPPSTAEMLDQALKQLADASWFDTRFKQRMTSQGVPWQAEGRYVVEPKTKKVRQESRIVLGDTPATHSIICDGETVWRIIHNANDRSVQQYKLQELVDAREKIDRGQFGEERTRQLIRDDDSEHGFLGIQPILLELKDKMVFPRVSQATLPGDKPVYVLEGEWTKAYVDKMAPPRKEGASGPDPAELWKKRQSFIRMPRTCKLYLGRQNLWPYRIEWFGPRVPGGNDELLTSLEFSEPVLTRPSSEQEIARLFQPDEEERRMAQHFDPSLLIRARQERLQRQTREEEEAARGTSPDSLPGGRP